MTAQSYWTVGEFARVPAPHLGQTPVDQGSPPSTYAVASVLEGERGSLIRLVGVTAIRAVFIVPGIWVGARLTRVELPWWKLAAMGGLASVTISLGMLAWYALRRAGTAVPAPAVMDGRRY